jgi:hypothetical protein
VTNWRKRIWPTSIPFSRKTRSERFTTGYWLIAALLIVAGSGCTQDLRSFRGVAEVKLSDWPRRAGNLSSLEVSRGATVTRNETVFAN